MDRDVFGDGHDCLDSGVCLLHDRVGSRRCGYEDDTGRNIMVPHRFFHGIIDRDTMDFLTAFPGGHTGDDTSAANLSGIGIHQADMKFSLLPGCALYQDTGHLIPVDHAATSTAFFTTRSMVSSIS